MFVLAVAISPILNNITLKIAHDVYMCDACGMPMRSYILSEYRTILAVNFGLFASEAQIHTTLADVMGLCALPQQRVVYNTFQMYSKFIYIML